MWNHGNNTHPPVTGQIRLNQQQQQDRLQCFDAAKVQSQNRTTNPDYYQNIPGASPRVPFWTHSAKQLINTPDSHIEKGVHRKDPIIRDPVNYSRLEQHMNEGSKLNLQTISGRVSSANHVPCQVTTTLPNCITTPSHSAKPLTFNAAASFTSHHLQTNGRPNYCPNWQSQPVVAMEPRQTACKRNVPPPPPRVGSWLGARNGQTNPGVISTTSNGAVLYPTKPTTCQQPSASVQSPSITWSHPCWTKYGGDHNAAVSSSSPYTHHHHTLPARLDKIGHVATPPTPSHQAVSSAQLADTLLRLLICHSIPPEQASASSSAIQQGLLVRLTIPAGSQPQRLVSPGEQDLAKRLLPKLIRMLYTESIPANQSCLFDPSGRGGESSSTGPSTTVSSDRQSSERASTVDQLIVNPNFMECSMEESRFSCCDDLDEEDDAATVADDLENVGIEEEGDSTHRTTVETSRRSEQVKSSSTLNYLTQAELDAFPRGTTVLDLKFAALAALYRLVPFCHTDANLCERDLGIVRILSTIYAYSTVLSFKCLVETANSNEAVDSGGASGSTTPKLPDAALALANRGGGGGGHFNGPLCPVAEVAALVRLSFQADHRVAICELGGIQALVFLLRTEQACWTSPQSTDAGLDTSFTLRRYICMALTNLTFRVATNKALICRRMANLEALLCQIESPSEELKQASASVLRNLSWRIDSRSKAALRRIGAPRRLTLTAMTCQRESTLRTTLSALWNLSSHCSHNKRAVCGVDGVFSFLLKTMSSCDLERQIVIVENSGGILRNISTIVASRPDYRAQLHQHNCYPILLDTLRRSPSLTVLVNVCGTFWNLTNAPNCPHEDRQMLARLNVVDLLRRLIDSPHPMIRSSSAAVLANLTSSTCNTTSFSIQQQSQPVTQPAPPQPDHHQQQDARRRPVNSRSQFRFGLLSVVLEADDADEQDSEEEELSTTDEEDQSDDKREMDQEEMMNREIETLVVLDSSLQANDYESHSSPIDDTGWVGEKSLSDQDNNYDDDNGHQTVVYAEEGTPYASNSTNASCLDLSNQRSRLVDESFNSPRVYAVEDTPLDQLSSAGWSRSSSCHKLGHSGERKDDGEEEGQLPPPPLEFSTLIQPLNRSTLANFDKLNSQDFDLPPPPPPISSSGFIDTPLVFSRGTGSYVSSFAHSSPQSEPESTKINGDSVGEDVRLEFAEEGSPPAVSPKHESRSGSSEQLDDDDVEVDYDDEGPSGSHVLQQCIASAMPLRTEDDFYNAPADGSVKEFAVEGTPYDASTKASSLSDLIADSNHLDDALDEQAPLISKADIKHQQQNLGVGGTSSSDSSSLSGDTSSDLLSEVIQSAMPKVTQNSNVVDSDIATPSESDCLRCYAVEGTPGNDENLSTASSSVLLHPHSLSKAFDGSSLGSTCSSNSSAASIPPAPPRRTSSSLSNKSFSPGQQTKVENDETVEQCDVSSTSRIRPLATVAPMPVSCATASPTSIRRMSPVKPVTSSKQGADTSSFSSLLSIESTGLERSLLQECISSAMPLPRHDHRTDGLPSHSAPTSHLHSNDDSSSGSDRSTRSQPSNTASKSSQLAKPSSSLIAKPPGGIRPPNGSSSQHNSIPVYQRKLLPPSRLPVVPSGIGAQQSSASSSKTQATISSSIPSPRLAFYPSHSTLPNNANTQSVSSKPETPSTSSSTSLDLLTPDEISRLMDSDLLTSTTVASKTPVRGASVDFTRRSTINSLSLLSTVAKTSTTVSSALNNKSKLIGPQTVLPVKNAKRPTNSVVTGKTEVKSPAPSYQYTSKARPSSSALQRQPVNLSSSAIGYTTIKPVGQRPTPSNSQQQRIGGLPTSVVRSTRAINLLNNSTKQLTDKAPPLYASSSRSRGGRLAYTNPPSVSSHSLASSRSGSASNLASVGGQSSLPYQPSKLVKPRPVVNSQNHIPPTASQTKPATLIQSSPVKSSNLDQSSSIPKSVRGGRKSLTGRRSGSIGPTGTSLLAQARHRPVVKPANSMQTSPAHSGWRTTSPPLAPGRQSPTPSPPLLSEEANGLWIVRSELSNGL